jgi:hypothetical protein
MGKSRRFAHAWIAGAAAVVVACGLTAPACITAPPPDLPQLPTRRPTVVNDAVQPPEGLLPGWPSDNQFVVPVEMGNPSPFVYNVFVDFPVNPVAKYSGSVTATVPPDGGIVPVRFPLDPPDPLICPHHVEFLVAHGFDPKSQHTFDGFGGDVATWEYFPGGSGDQCPSYDAGDGSVPDAPLDALPVAPESGSDR